MNLAFVNQCAVGMFHSTLHASQRTVHTTQPTLDIILAKCQTLCHLHCQNHGQEPDSVRGLISLLEGLERSLKKEINEN